VSRDSGSNLVACFRFRVSCEVAIQLSTGAAVIKGMTGGGCASKPIHMVVGSPQLLTMWAFPQCA